MNDAATLRSWAFETTSFRAAERTGSFCYMPIFEGTIRTFSPVISISDQALRSTIPEECPVQAAIARLAARFGHEKASMAGCPEEVTVVMRFAWLMFAADRIVGAGGEPVDSFIGDGRHSHCKVTQASQRSLAASIRRVNQQTMACSTAFLADIDPLLKRREGITAFKGQLSHNRM